MHNEPVEDRLRAMIRGNGPIGFDEFMEVALYGPGGYYERPPVGPDGDFVTSPHVHPVFGALIAGALRELYGYLGSPDPFDVVEVGAGDGTLARQVLASLPDLTVRYVAVERSDGARAALREIDGVHITDELPERAHAILANELIDNLPFRRVRGDAEILVGSDADRFVEVSAPLVDPTDGAEPGDERVIATGARRFVRSLAPCLDPGYALLIDYGDDGGAGGPVHGYRGHRIVEDVLEAPGTADITAGVDFVELASEAARAGLQAYPHVKQSRALASLGFEAWMRDELSAQGMSLNEGRGFDAVRTWAGRSRASILVDPTQLGRLRWFVVASPGLAQPSFLA